MTLFLLVGLVLKFETLDNEKQWSYMLGLTSKANYSNKPSRYLLGWRCQSLWREKNNNDKNNQIWIRSLEEIRKMDLV